MLASACTVVISAAEAETTFEPEYNTNLSEPTINYKQGRVDFSDTSDVAVSQVIKTAEDKIATMDCRLEKDGYRLYVDAYSGEVGVENIATGEILLTNPYDLSESNAPWSTKTALLSQLVVNFKDITAGQTITYYSADWTIGKAYSDKGVALDDEKIEPSQIRVKNIKNGLRVEYTIGREQTKMLVPRVIEKSAFEDRKSVV